VAAQGETMIGRVYRLDCGLERIEDKLGQCGAQIDGLAG
jgi:UDP-N-acetylglucosamine 1-carboxyvinyltransferase